MAHKKTFVRRLKDWIKFQSHPALEFSAEVDGSPNVKFSFQTHQLTDDQVKQLISESFDGFTETSKKTLIVFDEFQTIGQLEDKGWLEATIRTKMQSLKTSHLYSVARVVELFIIYSIMHRGLFTDLVS